MGAALKLSMMRRKETEGWVRHDGCWPSLAHFPIPAGAPVRLAQKPCQYETKLERSLYHHPVGLEMAPRRSEVLVLNIGQEQTVGTIRVLTAVDSRVILVVASCLVGRGRCV